MSRKIDIGMCLRRSAIGLALFVFLAIALWLNLSVRTEQQFSLLAQSFLHGRLDFVGPPSGIWDDTTPYRDAHYWPLGPFPAVLLMPFQFVAGLSGKIFYQGYLQILLVVAVVFLGFRIARQIGYDREDAIYAAFGFTFASAFLGVALWPWSWYFSQVVTGVALFAAIFEMAGQRRAWLIGLLFAICLATRATAALGIIWFIGEVLFIREVSLPQKLRSIGLAILPCAIVFLLLLLYNYARFENPFEQGYANQIIPETAAAARNVGVLSLHHLPANLYAMFFASPVPVLRPDGSPVLTFPFFAANPWGMGVFVTAPWLLCVFGLRYRDTTSRLILLTVIMIALPILLYYAVGYRQFGYRYSLDFLPFIWFAMLRNYREQRGGLSVTLKIAIVISAIWDFNLFAGHYLRHLT